MALFDVIFRTFKVIRNKFEGTGFVKVFDGKDALKNALEADIDSLIGRHIHLEEGCIALLLDIDQIRNFDNFAEFAVIVTDSKSFSGPLTPS